MKPKVISHNSISMDGSVTGFEVNMGLHYQIASGFKPELYLVGSNTAKVGVDMFMTEIPAETEDDFRKPEFDPDDKRAFWVIPDSQGKMKGLLHTMRRSEYGKDVIILASKKTTGDYLDYLEVRNYDYFILGDDRVDYGAALDLLVKNYRARTILTDAGPTLNCLLLELGLIDEISLLLCPVTVGKKSMNLFGKLGKIHNLEMIHQKEYENGYIHLLYRVR